MFQYTSWDSQEYAAVRNALLADRGFQGVGDRWPEVLDKPRGAAVITVPRDYHRNHGKSRVIVEQWNGRIKQTFYVLSDYGGYRRKPVVLDDPVRLCIAAHNELVQSRGYRGHKTPGRGRYDWDFWWAEKRR